ncbi:hypothetical protein ACFC5T_40235 [Streptomyces sp. NPDC055961]|uniref:hypothetical protein n=1 Tax=Streptomyces sp. NPDC055961 TaxID=3345666 RepID=UPI0035E09C83
MPEEDVKAALTAKRIAELEAELVKFSSTLAALSGVPDSPGHRYADERIKEIVAELDALKSPVEKPAPEKDGPPLHTVLLVIGLIVGVYGLAQHAWTAVLIGVALIGGSQLAKSKGTGTSTED